MADHIQVMVKNTFIQVMEDSLGDTETSGMTLVRACDDFTVSYRGRGCEAFFKEPFFRSQKKLDVASVSSLHQACRLEGASSCCGALCSADVAGTASCMCALEGTSLADVETVASDHDRNCDGAGALPEPDSSPQSKYAPRVEHHYIPAESAGVQVHVPQQRDMWSDGSRSSNMGMQHILAEPPRAMTVGTASTLATASASRARSRRCPPLSPRPVAAEIDSAISNWKNPDDFVTDSEAQGNPCCTTAMLRNVPNNYTREMLVSLLDAAGFQGRYNFVYLPFDFRWFANLGYAFVNMTSTAGVFALRKRLDGYQGWSAQNSVKALRVCWGKRVHQGLKANIERYRNSPVMHGSIAECYQPALFRGGRQVAFPRPTKKKIRTPKHLPKAKSNAP